MQPCNRIYYSTIHWRFNMFWAAYHSSSGALTVFAASGLHTHVVTGHSQVWVGTGSQWYYFIDHKVIVYIPHILLTWFLVSMTYALKWHLYFVFLYYFIKKILYPISLLNLIQIWWIYNEWMNRWNVQVVHRMI
jgi:hypothetical protein